MTVNISGRRRAALFDGGLGLAALLVLGCSGELDAGAQASPARLGASAQALEGDAGAEAPGLYLLGKFVDVEDGQLTYVDTASALAPADLVSFDPALEGLELPEAQLAVAHGDAVFLTDAFTPVVTRYDLDETGELVVGGSLSFAEAGLDFVSGWQLTIISDTKAYLFDTASSRALVWDPSTLTLTGELDLSLAEREGFSFDVGPREARRVGEKLFVPTYWYDEDFLSRKATGVFVIDTVSDELTFADDERCAAYSLVVQPSGDVYSFPDGYFAQEFYLDAAERSPLCALRISAGADTFDPEYTLDLGALVGAGADAGGAVQGGVGDGHGNIYLSVADEQRYADGEENVYRIWRWDGTSDTAVEQPDLPYWNAYMLSYTTGDSVLAQLPGVETTIVLDLSSPEAVQQFELTGWIEPFVRLR